MDKLNLNSIPFIYSETLYNVGEKAILKSENKVNEPPAPVTHVQESAQTYSNVIPLEGSNSNGVLIINNETAEQFINQNDKAFLSKIIGATKNDLGECALVNAFRKKFTLEALVEKTQATKIITFGVNLFDIGIQDAAPLNYECSNLPSGITIIPADKLAVISNNADKKKALWIALQRMFAI